MEGQNFCSIYHTCIWLQSVPWYKSIVQELVPSVCKPVWNCICVGNADALFLLRMFYSFLFLSFFLVKLTHQKFVHASPLWKQRDQHQTLKWSAEWPQFVVDYVSENLTYFTGDFRSSNISHNGRQYAVAESDYTTAALWLQAASRWHHHATANTLQKCRRCVVFCSRNPHVSNADARVSFDQKLSANVTVLHCIAVSVFVARQRTSTTLMKTARITPTVQTALTDKNTYPSK